LDREAHPRANFIRAVGNFLVQPSSPPASARAGPRPSPVHRVHPSGRKSVEENYEEAAGRHAYSVARFTSADYGCMLEAGGAFNTTSIFVFRELSSDVWTGGIKDWAERCVIGVRDRVGDNAHGREVELEAVGSERDLRLARRVQTMCHTEDRGRMRNKVSESINSGESAFGHDDELPSDGPW
jgi:hypothetical protein